MRNLTIIFLLFSSLFLLGQNEIKNLSSLDTNSFIITPNPFVDTTNIHFEINNTDTVTLRIFDRLGNIIATLVDNEALQSGQYDYLFVNDTLINGMYIVGLEINSEIFGKNLIKTDSINSIIQVKEREKNTLFPNPATNFLKVNFVNNSKREIRIINQNGKVIYSKEVCGKEVIVNVENLITGIYFISIKKGNYTTTEKILIE